MTKTGPPEKDSRKQPGDARLYERSDGYPFGAEKAKLSSFFREQTVICKSFEAKALKN